MWSLGSIVVKPVFICIINYYTIIAECLQLLLVCKTNENIKDIIIAL